jgi:hypothetical protein
MATHRLQFIFEGSDVSLNREVSETETGVALIDGEEVATGTTDHEIGFDLDVSACKSFYLVSDQDVTFEDVAAGSGVVIALKAGVPYVWHSDSYNAFLLTADVTSVFITNASGATATIYCLALYDPTPA